MTAESNKHIMERFTHEFLPTGDAALGEQFISRDIVLHFAGTSRETGTHISPSWPPIATLSRT